MGKWTCRSVLLALLAVGAVVAGGDADSIELPVSFAKVWYRPAIKTGFGSGKQSGLLTVTEKGLEFTAKKRSDVVRWSDVEMVSYGPMAGDPDTRWVVLELSAPVGARGLVGFRDGSRMGYGEATVPIFDAVIEGLRRAKAGPYDVPEGHTPYLARFLQFALALPADWNVLELSNTLSEGRPLWGRMLFGPSDLQELRADEARLKQALAEIAAGSEPVVQLDRYESGHGFTCAGPTQSGRRRLHDEISLILEPYRISGELRWEPRTHRTCTAWTADVTAEKDDESVLVRFFAVCDGQTVFLLTTRGDAVENERFEQFAGSLRTRVAP